MNQFPLPYQRIYAGIDLDAIEHNITVVRNKIPESTKLLLVVKADAYGHGATVIAHECEHLTDYFAVAEMNEAIELSKKYDEEKARPFVNGVLNGIKNELASAQND